MWSMVPGHLLWCIMDKNTAASTHPEIAGRIHELLLKFRFGLIDWKPLIMNYPQLLAVPVPPCFIYVSRGWCWYSFTDVMNVWMRTRVKNECERSAREINWGFTAMRREKCVCVAVCACIRICATQQPEFKRWITMETDCKPVGKQNNYDVLESKVRAVLRAGPLAIRYSSILNCITWPITLCVSEWFIAT